MLYYVTISYVMMYYDMLRLSHDMLWHAMICFKIKKKLWGIKWLYKSLCM